MHRHGWSWTAASCFYPLAKISAGQLPAGTLLLSSRDPIGNLAIASMHAIINKGPIALECIERASNFFMLNWCQTNMAEIQSRTSLHPNHRQPLSSCNLDALRDTLPPELLTGDLLFISLQSKYND